MWKGIGAGRGDMMRADFFVGMNGSDPANRSPTCTYVDCKICIMCACVSRMRES